MAMSDTANYLIKSALAKARKPVTEGPSRIPPQEPEHNSEYDPDEIVQEFIQEKGLRFNGSRASRDLDTLLEAIGYDGIEEFMQDNPGMQESLIQFIEEWVPKTVNHGPDGWYQMLVRALEDIKAEEEDKNSQDMEHGAWVPPGDDKTPPQQ